MDDLFIVNEDKDVNKAIAQLFIYYRTHGFPNYRKDNYNPRNELEKLKKFDDSTIINGKDLKQTMHSCGFLWTYFPHWINVQCGTDNSLAYNWMNDDKLKQLLLKTYKWTLKHGNGIITENRLRQNSKVYLSKQSVSNFRPTVAKYIYNTYGNEGTVLDMCSGYGGRLLGFLASNCKEYIGFEPCKSTFRGLVDLSKEYDEGKIIRLYNSPCEEYLSDKQVDLYFTSPPYFDTEKYSDEPTQSYKNYPTKELWRDLFLERMIRCCYLNLKINGYLILNVANVKTYPTLEEDTVTIASEIGFKLVDTLYLILSSIAGKGVKREPVFIFKKE